MKLNQKNAFIFKILIWKLTFLTLFDLTLRSNDENYRYHWIPSKITLYNYVSRDFHVVFLMMTSCDLTVTLTCTGYFKHNTLELDCWLVCCKDTFLESLGALLLIARSLWASNPKTLISDLSWPWPYMWPKEQFLIAHWNNLIVQRLSIAASPASLRLLVRELGRGGGRICPPPAGRVRLNTQRGAG